LCQYPSYGSKRCNMKHMTRLAVVIEVSVPFIRVEAVQPHCAAIADATTEFQYPSYGSKRCNGIKPDAALNAGSRFSTLHTGRSGATLPSSPENTVYSSFSTLHTGRSGATARDLPPTTAHILFQYPSYGSKRCNSDANEDIIASQVSVPFIRVEAVQRVSYLFYIPIKSVSVPFIRVEAVQLTAENVSTVDRMFQYPSYGSKRCN